MVILEVTYIKVLNQKNSINRIRKRRFIYKVDRSIGGKWIGVDLIVSETEKKFHHMF